MFTRSHAIQILRIAICLAALVWVFRGVQIADLATVYHRTQAPLLLGAIACFLLTPFLQAIRLRSLLAARGIPLELAASTRLAFVGNFLNHAAPLGSTAGDVYKAVVVARRAPQSWEAATVVLVDRAIGLVTLLFSVTLIAWVAGHESRLAALRGYLGVASALLAGGAAVVVLLPHRCWSALRERTASLRHGDKLERIVRTTRALLASPGALLTAVVVTLAIQIAAAASFLCIALSLGFRFGLAEWPSLYAFFSTGEIVKALPGPPQGLGTMELAYRHLFADWAGPLQIVSAALAIRIVGLLCALPGALLLTAGARRPAREPAPGAAPRMSAVPAAGA
ncbi:MAG: lysylphosphatidylglycerol synthase transmembrane domain-containing protein [Phycisphaerae bacterium]